MEEISWTAKVSNSEVLNRVEENSCFINMISQRKRRWLGHVLRHDVLLRDILEGRMTGKCTWGRKRLQLMSNICEGYETAKKRAEDRCLWCVSVMGVSDLLNSILPEDVLPRSRKQTSPHKISLIFWPPIHPGTSHMVHLWPSWFRPASI